MSEEVNTLVTILRHRHTVAAYMRRLAYALLETAEVHDLSKLAPDEFYGFVEINHIAREHEFGSDEYNDALAASGDVIGLHYQRNRHHPEHHDRGIEDMSLVDIVEMVADWQAASDVYGKTSFEKGLEVLKERFGLKPCHLYLIWLIHDVMTGEMERP